MAIESTAIHDLVAGLQSKPIPRDSDWLFGEQRGDATEIDTSRDVPALPPSAFGSPSEPMFDYALIHPPTPATPERTINWAGIAKKLALPIATLSLVIVAFGVYSAKADEHASPMPIAMAATVEAAPVEAAPVEAAPVEAAPVEAAPVEAAPVEAAPVEAAPAVAVVAPEPAAAAAPAPAPTTAPEDEKLNIEPGSPASRFLPATSTEPVIPTVTAKPVAAPAPTVVLGLAPPAKQKRTTEELGATIVAAPAKKTAAPARAAAKRAAKASSPAPKARSQKKVAVANADDDEDDDDAPVKKPVAAKPAGTGVLSIASTPAMEVWVDGRNSNAQTPVRIKLLAGTHKVTLLDKENAKARSFQVEIKPDATTKIVKNYE